VWEKKTHQENQTVTGSPMRKLIKFPPEKDAKTSTFKQGTEAARLLKTRRREKVDHHGDEQTYDYKASKPARVIPGALGGGSHVTPWGEVLPRQETKTR